jgi:hypothetical protein
MTGFAAAETTSNARSASESARGQAHDQQPAARRHQRRDPGQDVIQVEMVQHGHHGDQVSPAIARHRAKVSEVASLDAHLRNVTQTRARRCRHAFIAVDPGDMREVHGQLPREHAFPAADVYRIATAGGEVAQNPAVEVLVVVPGVTCIDLGQRLVAGDREVPDIHAGQPATRVRTS